MAKVKISEFDVNPDNNTDINNINIAEGCAPSGINNAIRQLMSDLKEFQTGAGGDPFNGAVNGTVGATTPSTGAFTTLSASGTFAANGGATLGDASGDALTINSSAVSIPNGLNFDSNTLVIDSTNNWVFVGKTASGVGTDGVQLRAGSFSGFSATSATALFVNRNTTEGSVIEIGQNGSAVCYLGNNGSGLTFGTAASERMRITSSGNVGIGTSSPATALQADSTSAGALRDVLSIRNGDSTANTEVGIFFNPTTQTTNIRGARISAINDGSNNVSLNFYTGSGATISSKMAILNNGNVGIGTSSPSVKFEVVGTIAASDGAGRLSRIIPSSTAMTYSINSDSGAHIFISGSNERMRLDSSGNLGLGVTPSAWWSGNKAQQIGQGLVLEARTGSALASFGSNYFINSSLSYIYINSAAASRYEQASGQHAWFNAPSGTAGTTPTFTQAMTLDASGNLGIGTTSPSYKLDVSGQNGRINFAPSTAFTYFDVANGHGTTRIGTDASAVGYVGTVSNLPLAIYTGNSERIRIDTSGNLLVGTTTANGTLTVNGNISPVATPATKWGIDFAPSTSAGTFVSIANDGTYDLIAGSGQVYIYDNDGNGVASFITYYGVVAISFQNATLYSVTADTAGKINFYFNGVSQYRIQNKTGATRNLFISTIRCRTAA